MGDATTGAGIGGVGSRGPRGLVGCGKAGGVTDVLISGGADEGAEEVVYADALGAGDPAPY